MKMDEVYNAAIYLRLSRDDGNIGSSKAESNSISSQKDMIRSFIGKQDNMEIYDIYTDDGWSGTNFDRPEFKRMMQDIEAGNVNCVIVKDLSRLGRDYIEAGRLIQKTFPAYSVRFIALTDHFDSLTADYNEKALVVPVKNFVNDFYARDISDKVRSHQKVKREKGDFIGAFAVYGYKKREDNRNQLIPDDYAARVVRKIFTWKIEGYSNIAIAEMLEELGILSPMEYKKVKGERYQTGFLTGIKTKWSAVAVKRILTNENYIGTLVQGKEERINYKVKRTVKKPEEEWIRVKQTHEAIISKEDYEMVQELLKVDIRASGDTKKSHIYAGLLYCGECGAPMIRRINRYKGKENISFICSTSNKRGKCKRHTILEKDLNYLLFTVLKKQVSMLLNKSKVLECTGQIEVNFEEMDFFEREIKRLRIEQEKYTMLRSGLYEDMKKQILTKEDFNNFGKIYEIRYQELEQAVRNQEKTLKKLFESGITARENLEHIKSVMQITELDRITLVSFVKRILVYEDKKVYVGLCYKELLSKVIMTADYSKVKESAGKGRL